MRNFLKFGCILAAATTLQAATSDDTYSPLDQHVDDTIVYVEPTAVYSTREVTDSDGNKSSETYLSGYTNTKEEQRANLKASVQAEHDAGAARLATENTSVFQGSAALTAGTGAATGAATGGTSTGAATGGTGTGDAATGASTGGRDWADSGAWSGGSSTGSSTGASSGSAGSGATEAVTAKITGDADGDGTISATEVENMKKTRACLKTKQFGTGRKLDANGDGSITVGEAKAGATRTEADPADDDGAAVKAARLAAIAAKRSTAAATKASRQSTLQSTGVTKESAIQNTAGVVGSYGQ